MRYLFLLSLAELSNYKYKLFGKGTFLTAPTLSVGVRMSKHLLFPLMRASNKELAGGYSNRVPVSRIGGPSNLRNSLASEDIVAFESPGQHCGA
jgi:hypothetical protein